MILDLFIVFVVISLFFTWLGIYAKRKLFSIVGLSIFFILCAWIILYSSASWLSPYVPIGSNLTGLEYKNATVMATSGTVTTITYQYAIYNDVTTFWVGLLFEIGAIFGLVIVWGFDE